MFVSASQNARVLTEAWVEHALFCPNCGAKPMARFAANRPAADFVCGACAEEYELKSKKGRLGPKVVDGAWATMTARLQAQNNPNLLVMSYDARRAAVTDPSISVIPESGVAACPGPRATRATCTPGSRLSAPLRPG